MLSMTNATTNSMTNSAAPMPISLNTLEKTSTTNMEEISLLTNRYGWKWFYPAAAPLMRPFSSGLTKTLVTWTMMTRLATMVTTRVVRVPSQSMNR